MKLPFKPIINYCTDKIIMGTTQPKASCKVGAMFGDQSAAPFLLLEKKRKKKKKKKSTK